VIYKKGQIIPRRLVRCKNRKAQFLYVFCVDVEVVGRVITALDPGPLLHQRYEKIKGKNGKPNVLASCLIENVHFKYME